MSETIRVDTIQWILRASRGAKTLLSTRCVLVGGISCMRFSDILRVFRFRLFRTHFIAWWLWWLDWSAELIGTFIRLDAQRHPAGWSAMKWLFIGVAEILCWCAIDHKIAAVLHTRTGWHSMDSVWIWNDNRWITKQIMALIHSYSSRSYSRAINRVLLPL